MMDFLTSEMLFLCWILLVLYTLMTAVFFYAWRKYPEYLHKCESTHENLTTISVLIAVRNEEAALPALLRDLENQTYPAQKFEVLFLDDHSEDRTPEILEIFRQQTPLQVKIVRLPEGITGKKKALQEGIQQATGVLIVTTDGDCRVGAEWLSTIEGFYRTHQLKMISGGVTFTEASSLREKILTVEFASLVGSGASSLVLGLPTMCNGANLAYEKQAFEEVGGYAGVDHIASGDDEFLMHKLYRRYPGKVAFLKNKEAVVKTAAPDSWRQFFEQRRRWASKWGNYSFLHVQLIALLVFAARLALITGAGLVLFAEAAPEVFLMTVAFEIVLEFLFLRSVLVYFGTKINITVFLLTELLHPFYVVLFGLVGQTGKYQWKGREIKKQ
jgi:cellulose synthase/poly-beta-1,6-N-acetylglucosamine synthase-like glycosyltransferase